MILNTWINDTYRFVHPFTPLCFCISGYPTVAYRLVGSMRSVSSTLSYTNASLSYLAKAVYQPDEAGGI